ncbi:MAG: pyridoxamine 5'-phosphate oxidase family protein [Henriciella sp.]|uniref:pyridoxamine 5'-phosphate oxidase family protein n=1 Tax=Henriciella sp. TaxID=1968823 RepID=UPI0032EDFC5B
MADIDKLKQDPKEQLFKHLDDLHAVMLGSPDPKQHMQPMAPEVDFDSGEIWFFTRASSDLVEALGRDSADVHMCAVEKDYQACLMGELSVERNEEKIEQFWSAPVAAWFEGGKADNDLTMLRFKPKNASIWASDRNPITFAYEIAKANVKDKTPDVGERNSVNFR